MTDPNEPAPEVTLPPDCLEVYEPRGILGQGGFGAVIRARDRRFDRDVAIKVLRSDHLENPEEFERLVDEARVTASLRDPHIIQLLDFGDGRGSGTPWLAYELVPGESLEDRLAQGPLPVHEATQLLYA